MALDFQVQPDLCTRCGECAQDCPAGIIALTDSLPRIDPEQEGDCIECQHCLAVCPPGAISIFGFNPRQSRPLTADRLPTCEATATLMRGRRSVRRYRPEPVESGLLRELLATVANSPTACNHRALTFILIDDPQVMNKFRELTLAKLAEAAKLDPRPEKLDFLWDAIPAYYERKEDWIFRGAPQALIVTAQPDAFDPAADVFIALSYFELLAASAGLGTVWCGMLKLALEGLPELKAPLGLPADHFYYPILLGRPAVEYARTVQRDRSATIKPVKF